MNYMITFFGHIDVAKRPIGFPDVVHELIVINTTNIDAIVKAANDASQRYIRDQGMSVGLKPHLPDEVGKLDLDRVWVPMHMITHITLSVRTVEGEVPQMSTPAGDLKFPSGKDLRLN